jgi:hypothetical protein
MVTRRPRASSREAIEADASPLPSDETTPPETKMNFVFFCELRPDEDVDEGMDRGTSEVRRE